jgi:CheY-like chemotaxis protein
MLQREHYDIVLCDWEMPGLSGIDLLKWMRSDSALNALPFVVASWTAEKENV